jgi:hypothetical protein
MNSLAREEKLLTTVEVDSFRYKPFKKEENSILNSSFSTGIAAGSSVFMLIS